MSYPPNSPDDSGSPDRPYSSSEPYPPQRPSYAPPQPPSYAPPQLSYQQPQSSSNGASQASYPVRPDYQRAPASSGPAVGSSGVYGSARPAQVSAAPGGPIAPQFGSTTQFGSTQQYGSTTQFGSTQQLGATPQFGAGAQFGSPMSGPPSAPPFDPMQRGPQPAGGRRRGAPLLAAVTVLLLLVGGVMSALYVTKNSELSSTKRDVAAEEAKVKDLEQQLQKAKDDLADVRQDLTGTQNAQKETQRQKQVISKCLTLIAQAGQAAERNDRTTYNKVIKEVDKVCTEADKYLD